MKTKRLFISIIALLLFSFNGLALKCTWYSYKVYDENGEPLCNTNMSVRMSYMQDDSVTVVYSNSYEKKSNINGIISFTFSPMNSTVEECVAFRNIEYVKNGYIKMELDPTATETYTISGVFEYGQTEYLKQEQEKAAAATKAFSDSIKNAGIVVARAYLADTANYALEADYAKEAKHAEEANSTKEATYADTAKYVAKMGSIALVPVKLAIVDDAGVSPTVTLAGNVYTASATESITLPSYCPAYLSVTVPDDKLANLDHYTISINGKELSSYDGLYYTDVQSVDFDEQKVYYNIVQIYLNRNKSLSNIFVGPFPKTDGTVNEITFTFIKKIN